MLRWKTVAVGLALISLGSAGLTRAYSDVSSASSSSHNSSSMKAEGTVPILVPTEADKKTRLRQMILLWLLAAQPGK
jgi:hypothetical protein